MLIIEIILTVFAWRNGWKWRSLIPVGTAMIVGFMIGFVCGSMGTPIPNPITNSVWIIDVLACISLIIMITHKPEDKSKEENK